MRVTRLAMKRAAEGQENLGPVLKKRVVLGDISNLGNNNNNRVFDLLETTTKEKPKCRRKKRVKEDVERVGIDLEGGLEDPQMCAPYASDIYAYLTNMEVCVCFLSFFWN